MCLINNPSSVQTLLEKYKEHESLPFWKRYQWHENALISPYYRMILDLSTNKIRSDATRKLSKVRCFIDRGIHVFQTRRLTKELAWEDELIIKVWGNKEDLIGANNYEAVFKKVYIDETQYHQLCRRIYEFGEEAEENQSFFKRDFS